MSESTVNTTISVFTVYGYCLDGAQGVYNDGVFMDDFAGIWKRLEKRLRLSEKSHRIIFFFILLTSTPQATSPRKPN